MPQGGDLTSVFIARPDGSTRKFPVASGGDNSRILGGRFTEEVEANGDGSVRDIVRNRPGEREVVLSIDDRNGDHEWLIEASRATEFSTVSYAHVGEIVYSHRAKPMGDMSKNDGNATVTVTFKGTEISKE
jgi:hypothetical protein